MRCDFLSHATSLRQAYNSFYDCRVRQRKCRSILKHVLKSCDDRKPCRRPVVSLSHATKIVPCKSALSSSSLDFFSLFQVPTADSREAKRVGA